MRNSQNYESPMYERGTDKGFTPKVHYLLRVIPRSYISLRCSRRRKWMMSSGTMMTSSNGNIFRVTGPLCGEFTGPGEFPTQRPVTRSFDVFFDLRLNKGLSKQPWGWWFETPSCSLWRHRNDLAGDNLHYWATFPKTKLAMDMIISRVVYQIRPSKHDDVSIWKQIPHHRPFGRGNHRSPVVPLIKDQ